MCSAVSPTADGPDPLRAAIPAHRISFVDCGDHPFDPPKRSDHPSGIEPATFRLAGTTRTMKVSHPSSSEQTGGTTHLATFIVNSYGPRIDPLFKSSDHSKWN